MKTYVNRIILVSVLIAFGDSAAHAYATSQEGQWQADLVEAKARSRDFEKHLARLRDADRKRESAANEIKVERRRDDERVDRARRDFIKERESRPPVEIVERNLEREHLKQLASEQRASEKIRESFATDRARKDLVLHKEAYINPAREYGVYSARSVSEQAEITQTYSKPLLKLNIKSGSDSSR